MRCDCFCIRLLDTISLSHTAWYYIRQACTKLSCRKKPKKPVVILVLGLDNAGKSAIVNYIFNKSLLTKETVIPTIGFRTVRFDYKSFSVRMYDVGGGPQIRALWPKYYGDVHGVIYVVDSSDNRDRMFESASVFQDVVCHELISRKPILFLGNKQEVDDAIDESELIEFMNVERIVNFAKTLTRIEVCSCMPDEEKNRKLNLNRKITKGFEWLMQEINRKYCILEERINDDNSKESLRRSLSLKSWTAGSTNNSFEYSSSDGMDSETYMKPIVPDNNVKYKKRKRKKQKSVKNIFCIPHNNRTGPMPGNVSPTPTVDTMRELIRSMTIEDLIKNTEIDENAISQYRRPQRKTRKRPVTAPPKCKPYEINPIQRAPSDEQSLSQP